MMGHEKLTSLLDTYGPFQKRLLAMVFLPLVMNGYILMIVVITFYVPEHRCKIPGLDNDTFAIQDDVHRQLVNRSVPLVTSDGVTRFSRCQLYADNSSVGPGGRATEDCRAWVYDTTEFDRTIATQFDFVCKDKGYRANFNMLYMIGMVVGSPLAGFLCDRFGRQPFVIIGFIGCVVTGIATAFPVLPEVLLLYRALMSLFGILMYLSVYVLSMEMMGPEQRNLCGTLMQVLWLGGPILGAGLSFLVTDWRYLQLIGAAPFALCLTYIWLIPESPRWLLSKNRIQKAEVILKKVAKVNKLSYPSEDETKESENRTPAGETGANIQTDTQADMAQAEGQAETHLGEGGHSQRSNAEKENEDEGHVKTEPYSQKAEGTIDGKQVGSGTARAVEVQNKSPTKTEERNGDAECGSETKRNQRKRLSKDSPLRLLKYPNLVARTGIIFFNWIAVTMTYYGLSLNVSNLGGSVRVNFLLSNAVELVGYIIAWLLLDRLGRKRLHCGVMLLAGIACLATIFTVVYGGPDLQWLTTALAMVGKLGVSAAFSSIYLVTAELFPTVIRNFGLGCSSTSARVAGIVSPYVSDLGLYVEGPVGQALPLVIFGALALAAGLLALFLPETLHRTLPETLEDAANFTKKQDEVIPMEELKHPTKTTNG